MSKEILFACLPWVGVVVASVIVARLLIGLSGAKLDLRRLARAHRCQEGSVQSLSFVLTLPIFLLVMMLIVQASQIMIGNIMVHYAAFASVRSAVVWIPSNVNNLESANRISSFRQIGVRRGDIDFDSELDIVAVIYEIFPEGPKYNEIRSAAVLAVTPMGPSRSLGYEMTPDRALAARALGKLYAGLDAESENNTRIPARLANKLAYCDANTDVNLTFWHRQRERFFNHEPPLQIQYEIPPYPDEFQLNELGWQDSITSTVSFNIPLLPGPVRLFAPAARREDVSRTDANGEVYTFLISASATMVVEGEKPLIPHWQEGL